MADVFISYSRKDSDFVHKLDNALRQENRDVWVDWQERAAAEFQTRPNYVQAREEIQSAVTKARAAVKDLSDLQDEWTSRLNAAIEADPFDDPPADFVEPILAKAPEPIACAGDDYPTHARKLIDRKQLDGEGAP